MKSKTLLLSGLLALGAAAGIASYAVSQSSPSFFTRAEGDDTETEEPAESPMALSSTIPAMNAEIPSTDPVTAIYMRWSFNSDLGISVDRTLTPTLEITKDGEPYTTVDLTSKESFYVEANQPNGMVLVPAKPLSEPGTYSLTVPKGIASGEGMTEDGTTKNVSNATTLTFKVVFAVPYEVNAPNGDVVASQIQTINLTYPEGAVVTLKSSTVKLMSHDIAGSADTEICSYNVSAKGNVVTLTTDEVIPNSAKTIDKAWYYINLPAGLWTIAYKGQTVGNAVAELGKWKVIAYNASLIQTNPAAGTEQAVNKFEKLRLKYTGGDMEWIGSSASSLTLKVDNPNGGSANTLLYYGFDSVDNNGMMTFTLKSTSKPLSQLITTDKYYLEIPANVLKFGDSKNSKLIISGYNIKGLDYLPITSTYDNSVQTKLQNISLTFPFNAMIADKEKGMIIKKNGEVVATVLAGTLTEAGFTNGKGQSSANFKQATADTGSGIYEITVQAGTFCWANNPKILNDEFTFKIYLNPENPAFTTVPTQFDPANPNATLVDEINTIEVAYPAGAVLTPIKDNPTLTFGYQFSKNWSNTSSGTTNFNITPKTSPLEYDGNKIIFKTSTVKQAMRDDQVIVFRIPAGTFYIDYNGVKVPNNIVQVGVRIKDVATPTVFLNGENGVLPSEIVPMTPGTAIPVENITGAAIASAPSFIGLEFFQSVYKFPATKTDPDTGTDANIPVYLYDESGEIITQVSPVKVPDTKQWYWAIFLTAAQADKIPSGTHNYTIKIPAGAVQCGSSTATATTAVFNPNEITIPVTLEKPLAEVAYNEVFAYDTPEEINLDNCFGANFGYPFGMGAVQLKAAQGIALVNDSEETVKLYKGTELVKEISAEDGIVLGGIGTAADEATLTNTVTFYFCQSPGEVTDVYKQDGEWKVAIPAGLFTVNGNPVSAGEFTYNYTNKKEETVWEYEVTPADGSEVGDKISTITLTVTNADYVTYNATPGKLYDPEGNQVKYYPSAPKTGDKSLTWTIGNPANNPIEWKTGTYTFKIAKNTVYVNISDDEDEGNFPSEDLNILYIVDISTGVSILGVEAADSYNVYTLDGKAVLINAAAEKLVELENGLYIINGKKAIVRK